MPGPSNSKRKQKTRNKQVNKTTRNETRPREEEDDEGERGRTRYGTRGGVLRDASSGTTVDWRPPTPRYSLNGAVDDSSRMISPPFIHDPGNGPRVRDARMFLGSLFAQPPSLEDALCREFAQEEVLQMLMTVLPEETALIVWYNRSRTKSRVCPACQRLYRIGEVLQDLIEEKGIEGKPMTAMQLREQELSGLCSPVCFVVASINFPDAIRSAWGRRAEEMEDARWEELNGRMTVANETSRTLGMVVKMTRLDDLGLEQLCF